MGQGMQACATCHGPQGRTTNSGYFPRIAGKPAANLCSQFIIFREGRCQSARMDMEARVTQVLEIKDRLRGQGKHAPVISQPRDSA